VTLPLASRTREVLCHRVSRPRDLAFALCCIASVARAQAYYPFDASDVRAGAEVRVFSVESRAAAFQGVVRTRAGDTIAVQQSRRAGQLLRFSLSTVDSIQMPLTGHRNATRWMTAGAMTGGVLGIAVYSLFPPRDQPAATRRAFFRANVLGGAFAGFGVGAVVSVVPTTNWVTVRLRPGTAR